MAPLVLLLFGAPTIIRSRTGELAPVHIGRRKAIALLAYLAVTGLRYHRAALARLLWPAFAEKAGRAEVRRALAMLAGTLGDHWLDADRETIALAATPDLWVDVVEFRRLLHAAAASEGASALDLRQRAVKLAQADFLSGFTLADAPEFEQWQLLEMQQLRRELAGALEELAGQLAAAGDFAAALDHARRWLALDPLHEPAHRRLMALHAANNDPRSAIRQYRACLRILKQELNLPPADETTALYEQIGSGDLAGRTSSLPGVARSRPPPHNLPSPPAPLIGRGLELDGLGALLADPEQRLITLTGPGGIGKTWLAIQAAQQELDAHPERWPDGLFWASLSAVENSQLLPAAILDALPAAREGAAPPQAQLLDYLQGRKLLLVLDNLEQLLGEPHIATVADLFDEILGQTAGVKLLVTSRERINLAGETVVNLLGLPFPANSDEAAADYDAVQLFVRSARRSDRTFALDAGNRAPVVRICQLAQGLPLAIELAASWVRLLSCHEIAGEIERNLDLLAAAPHSLPTRHSSLRAVFDHSWHLLSAEQQQVLRRLAVFRGSFTREKAGQATGATLPLLAGLVDKSLLYTNRHSAQRRRYQIHEQVRQFAYENLVEAGETNAAHERHLAAFLALAEQVAPQLVGAQQSEGLALLQPEHTELHAAIQWALAAGQAASALRLGVALWRFWVIRGYLNEGRHWLETLLATPPQVEAALLAQASFALGCLAYYASDLPAADQWLARAVRMQRTLDDPPALAAALLRLGMAKQERREFAAALALHDEAAARYRSLADEEGLFACLSSSASLAYDMGEIEQAEALFAETLAIARRRGDPEDIAVALANLGWTAALRGNWPDALAYAVDGLQRFQELDHRFGLLFALEGVAGALAPRDAAASVRLFAAAAALRRQFHMRHPPANEEYIRRMMHPARQQLDDAAFAEAWRTGSALTLAAAVAEALLPTP